MPSAKLAFLLASSLWLGLIAPLASADGVACLAVLEQYQDKGVEYYDELKEVATLLESVDTQLLDGRKKPTLQDVDVLEKISMLMMKAERFRGESQKQVFAALRGTLPQASVVISEGTEPTNATDYKPNEAELKTLYQAVWNRVASELPKEMGLPLIKISYRLQKRAALKDAGKQVLEHAGEKFESLFESTSGFAGFEAFEAKLNEQADAAPAVRQAVDMIASEGVEVVIQAPESARWWTMKVGLQNLHVTGTSGGYKGKDGRNAAEASYADMSKQDFSKLDATVKPVYALLQPGHGFEKSMAKTDIAYHYGNDGFVVSIDKVRDRLSFVFGGDSLNRARSFVPYWARGIAETPKSWDQTFIPWKYRVLIADSIRENKLEFKRSSLTNLRNMSGIQNDYVEVQIFGGGVDVSELSAFEFRKEQPSGDFLTSLRKAGLEIRKRTESGSEVWENDLVFRDLKLVKNESARADGRVGIQSVKLREVSFKGDVLDPQYEWAVDITTSEDLGDFTHRLKLVDAESPDRRIQPTVARVSDGGPPFIYRVRVPDVKLHDAPKFYVKMISPDGKSAVHSNEGRPNTFFVFKALAGG